MFLLNLTLLVSVCLYAVLSFFVLTVRNSRTFEFLTESGLPQETFYIALPNIFKENKIKIKLFSCNICPTVNTRWLLSHIGEVATLIFTPHALYSIEKHFKHINTMWHIIRRTCLLQVTKCIQAGFSEDVLFFLNCVTSLISVWFYTINNIV